MTKELKPGQGITREQALEMVSEAERPILEILLRGGPIKTNRFCLAAAREIVRADVAEAERERANARITELELAYNTLQAHISEAIEQGLNRRRVEFQERERKAVAKGDGDAAAYFDGKDTGSAELAAFAESLTPLPMVQQDEGPCPVCQFHWNLVVMPGDEHGIHCPNYSKNATFTYRPYPKLTKAQADEIEDEMRRLEADPSVDKHAMRLFMQHQMPCGHSVGSLLTCPDPPFGCVICGEPNESSASREQQCPVCGHGRSWIRPSDNTCGAPVPICSDDYHGSRACGCHCVTPSPIEQQEPKVSNFDRWWERRKQHP